MNSTVQLLELYDQWKSLTEREGAAILASDWTEVHRCQQSKQKLQPQIIHASDEIKNLSRHMDQFEPRLRECINELIQLENFNSANLELRLKSAREEKDNLDRTSQRLRQIHKSYVPSQGSVWDQYS
jgi:predicted RNase H-like nuclease (RuvC/YqgF family)